MNKEKHVVILRVPKKLHDKLKKVAEEEKRNVTQQVLYFIEKGLKDT